jgi:alpha-methylacyl-CoA racemase
VLKEKISDIFKTKTRAEWCQIMESTDICFAPVLSLDEAPDHPHNRERKTFVEVDGVIQPAPAPRFSQTPPELKSPPPKPGEHTKAVLEEFGFSADEIAGLEGTGAI